MRQNIDTFGLNMCETVLTARCLTFFAHFDTKFMFIFCIYKYKCMTMFTLTKYTLTCPCTYISVWGSACSVHVCSALSCWCLFELAYYDCSLPYYRHILTLDTQYMVIPGTCSSASSQSN